MIQHNCLGRGAGHKSPQQIAAGIAGKRLAKRILPELEPVLAAKERLSKLTAFVSHGEQDTTLPLHWAQRSDALLTQLGVPHSLHLYAMDHGISAEMQADFLIWLSA